MTEHSEILEFWFDTPRAGPEYLRDRGKIWFSGGEEYDRLIAGKFEEQLRCAAAGDHTAWEKSADSCLALLLLLDQFPRNIYRGTARAFFFDPLARRIALAALAKEFDRELTLVQRVFFYLPLEHAEDLTLQQRSVACYERLAEMSAGDVRNEYDGYLSYARAHLATIEKFGRFPGRNVALGRESSPEEKEFLATGQRFVGLGGELSKV